MGRTRMTRGSHIFYNIKICNAKPFGHTRLAHYVRWREKGGRNTLCFLIFFAIQKMLEVLHFGVLFDKKLIIMKTFCVTFHWADTRVVVRIDSLRLLWEWVWKHMLLDMFVSRNNGWNYFVYFGWHLIRLEFRHRGFKQNSCKVLFVLTIILTIKFLLTIVKQMV